MKNIRSISNKNLSCVNITLALISLIIITVFNDNSLATSLSAGYMSASIVALISPSLRTPSQEEIAQQFANIEHVFLFILAIVMPLIIAYFAFFF